MTLAWVFFRTVSLEQAGDYLLALFGHWPHETTSVTPDAVHSVQTWVLLSVAVVLALGAYPWLQRAFEPVWRRLADYALDGWVRAALVAPALILSSMSIALGQYNPFIYFRF